MTDDLFHAGVTPPADGNVRRLIAFILEVIHHRPGPASPDRVALGEVVAGLERLQLALERRYHDHHDLACYQEILQRAPWLTGDVTHLARQQSQLRQVLQSLQEMAHKARDTAALTREFARTFEQFAEAFYEFDAAECELLERAFPAPDWVDQEQ